VTASVYMYSDLSIL